MDSQLGFSLILDLVWLMAGSLIVAKQLKSPEPKQKSSFFLSYLKLSALLGGSIVLSAVVNLLVCNEFKSLLIGLWFLAWSPVSLYAVFQAPRKYCVFPIAFIVISCFFCGATALTIGDFDEHPRWPYSVLSCVGIFMVIASLATYKVYKSD